MNETNDSGYGKLGYVQDHRSPPDCVRLEASIAHPATPQKHVWRCRIVLLSAQGHGTMAVVTQTGKSRKCVLRWQARFLAEGVDGLLREKTRRPGTPKTGNAENRGWQGGGCGGPN
ncbi:helix-turn-helix domain-containing protein [Paracoccus sp. (in: a-proteobacteria)]|uniref:helix-turn-helix domain-containing protein n=1 Tax=Paracoccus sp. TaxID=267 RepID=UPI003A852E5D